MNRPNLFSYATSELSQDAFICWLLSWANPEYRNMHPALHSCATSLVKALFEKHGKTLSKIEKIEISRQYKHIDVFCIINDQYAVIIEDKIGAQQSKEQLQTYLTKIENEHRFRNDDIIPIYFKTEDQCDYYEVENKGYKLFLRVDFLTILNNTEANISNQIFNDYREHLQSISDQVDGYKTIPLSEWGWYQWVGFYIALREMSDTLKQGKWSYVPNKAGGFLGFWWFWDKNTGSYLQMEQELKASKKKKGRLCFKIQVDDVDNISRTEKKWEWHNKVIEAAKKDSLPVRKPSRLRNGHWMTVAVVDDDYRSANKDGTLNMAETIEIIRQAEECIALARFMKV